jgi:hypothetical protein
VYLFTPQQLVWAAMSHTEYANALRDLARCPAPALPDHGCGLAALLACAPGDHGGTGLAVLGLDRLGARSLREEPRRRRLATRRPFPHPVTASRLPSCRCAALFSIRLSESPGDIAARASAPNASRSARTSARALSERHLITHAADARGISALRPGEFEHGKRRLTGCSALPSPTTCKVASRLAACSARRRS